MVFNAAPLKIDRMMLADISGIIVDLEDDYTVA